MWKKMACVASLLGALCFAAGVGLAQASDKPFTKEEILRLLKTPPGERFEQGDLAGEVAARGVAFPVTEETLGELRKAGARSFLIDAIRRADPNAPKSADLPHLQPRGADGPAPAESADPEAARAAAIARLPLIEQARAHALEFVEELPNFIVTQTVTRYVKTPEKKDWQLEDKLEIELTYRVKEGEKFKLLRVNGRPTTMSYDKLDGATSTGEFGSLLGALFAPQSQAEFKEVRHEKFRGRDTAVYDFRVKKAFSSNEITDKSSGRTVTAGYQGSVWVDTETKRVLRVEQSCDDIQRGFPITLAENAVEYDWVKIGEGRYLLPVSAEVILGRDSERQYSRNVIVLSNYHMFETDVKLVPDNN
jgi:hypothetical protein